MAHCLEARLSSCSWLQSSETVNILKQPITQSGTDLHWRTREQAAKYLATSRALRRTALLRLRGDPPPAPPPPASASPAALPCRWPCGTHADDQTQRKTEGGTAPEVCSWHPAERGCTSGCLFGAQRGNSPTAAAWFEANSKQFHELRAPKAQENHHQNSLLCGGEPLLVRAFAGIDDAHLDGLPPDGRLGEVHHHVRLDLQPGPALQTALDQSASAKLSIYRTHAHRRCLPAISWQKHASCMHIAPAAAAAAARLADIRNSQCKYIARTAPRQHHTCRLGT